MGTDFHTDLISCCLVRDEPLARKLCLQNRTELVDFCFVWVTGIGNCIANSKLAKLEGCYKKSSGSFEIRVNTNPDRF